MGTGHEDSHVLHDVVDEEDDGRAFSGGVLVDQSTRPVLAHDELG